VRKLALFLLVGAAALGTLGIAGCGGGDSDEDQINETIETAFTSEDSELCDLITQSLLEELTDETGEQALEQCRERVGETEPNESVEISEVTIEGDEAKATFKAIGGDDPGNVQATLVKEDDDWKFDEVDFESTD
jgi:hypothetical protein